MTQNAKLLCHLRAGYSITQMQAFIDFGICRLSQRIIELERLGWTIKHESVSVPTRDGKTAKVTRYSLLSEPESRAA